MMRAEFQLQTETSDAFQQWLNESKTTSYLNRLKAEKEQGPHWLDLHIVVGDQEHLKRVPSGMRVALLESAARNGGDRWRIGDAVDQHEANKDAEITWAQRLTATNAPATDKLASMYGWLDWTSETKPVYKAPTVGSLTGVIRPKRMVVPLEKAATQVIKDGSDDDRERVYVFYETLVKHGRQEKASDEGTSYYAPLLDELQSRLSIVGTINQAYELDEHDSALNLYLELAKREILDASALVENTIVHSSGVPHPHFAPFVLQLLRSQPQATTQLSANDFGQQANTFVYNALRIHSGDLRYKQGFIAGILSLLQKTAAQEEIKEEVGHITTKHVVAVANRARQALQAQAERQDQQQDDDTAAVNLVPATAFDPEDLTVSVPEALGWLSRVALTINPLIDEADRQSAYQTDEVNVGIARELVLRSQARTV